MEFADLDLHELLGEPAQALPQGVDLGLALVLAQQFEECHPEVSGHR